MGYLRAAPVAERQKEKAVEPLVKFDEKVERLRGRVKRRRMCSVDLETVTWRLPYAVGFYDGETFRSWEARRRLPKELHEDPACTGYETTNAVRAFLRWFLTPEWSGFTCYAHNGGRFDFLSIAGYLLRGPLRDAGFTTRISPIQSCIFRLEVTSPDHEGSWIFLDSARFMNQSLAEMAKTFGVTAKGDPRAELVARCGDLQKAFEKVTGRPPDQVTEVGREHFTLMALREHRDIMLRYLKRDCVALLESMKKAEDLVNGLGGALKSTAPSTSMDVYRRAFQPCDFYTNRHIEGLCMDVGKRRPRPRLVKSSRRKPTKPRQEVCLGCGHRYAREAYYGGRTEIFTMAGKCLLYLDVNSHYPAAMLVPMPIGIAKYATGGDPARILEGAQGERWIGIIDCEVEIPSGTYLPPLPVRLAIRRNRNGLHGETVKASDGKAAKLVFPTGTFRGTWDTAELLLLAECGGRITKVHAQAWYPTRAVFADFIMRMFAYRKPVDGTAPDPGLSALAKLMMNALYGKWAQGELQTEFLTDVGDEEWSGGTSPVMDELGLEERTTAKALEHSVPQMAVHVTAVARARLWKMMNAVLQLAELVGVPRERALYYCDTDSIIISAEVLKRARQLPQPKDAKDRETLAEGLRLLGGSKVLGELKLEHKIARARFVSNKLYRYRCDADCPHVLEMLAKGLLPRRDNVRAKGFGKGLGQSLDVAEFERICDFRLPAKDRAFARERILMFREALAPFHTSMDEELLRTAVTSKTVDPEGYDKRIQTGGDLTAPWVLDGGVLVRHVK